MMKKTVRRPEVGFQGIRQTRGWQSYLIEADFGEVHWVFRSTNDFWGTGPMVVFGKPSLGYLRVAFESSETMQLVVQSAPWLKRGLILAKNIGFWKASMLPQRIPGDILG